MIRLRYLLARLGLTGLVALLVFCSAQAAEGNRYNLPEFGEPADRSLALFEERELGAEVYRQLLRHSLILDDRELEAYLNKLGGKLAEASGAAGSQKFRFFALRDSAINAFALPGGYIGVHTGLIRAARDEAELAAVLAHEIAHVTQRHIARQIDGTKGWDIASAALLLAALVAGASDPDLVQAALGIGMSLSYQQKVNYTRSHELEADRLGIRTLSDAGYSPTGMENFFRRLAAQSRLYGDGIPELLRTHPYSTTRMAEARNRSSSLPAGVAEQSRVFQLMQVRAEIAELDLASEKLARYPQPTSDGDATAHYGRAQALRAQGEHAGALSAARQALATQRYEEEGPTLALELARNLALNGEAAAAVQILLKLHEKQPANHAATLDLARLQLEQGGPEAVRQLLIESEAYAAGLAEVFRLLAQAAGELGEPGEAHYQLANWHFHRGDWAAAIRQLQHALRQQDWDEYSQSRLQGRLNALLASAPDTVREELRQKPRDQRNLALREAAALRR